MSDVSISTILFLIFVALLFVLYMLLQWKIGKAQKTYRIISQIGDLYVNVSNQQEDVFNISSRVQGQGQGQGQGHWPTHDAHVSLDHFTITNELNKYNDQPPTYEEAMSLSLATSTNPVVPAVTPKVTTTPTTPSETVTVSLTTTTTTATN